MFKRRKAEAFNLAFLDIMSCGLGAVLLIFLIIKHNTDAGSVEANALLQELQSMRQQKQELESEIEKVSGGLSQEQKASDELRRKLLDIQKAIASLDREIADKKRRSEQLKSTVEELEQKERDDVVEIEAPGEEQYLIGLKVEGGRIAILVDRSASMTDEKLIDIIARKIDEDSVKQQGPKWQRTLRIVRWLSARLPKQSRVAVIAFNDKAHNLGPAQWLDSGDSGALSEMLAEAEALVPDGATNLQAGLEQLRKLSPAPSDVYLVTDGLPTTGRSGSGGLLSGCRSLRGKGNSISGECRVKLFRATIRDSTPRGRVNVVLLPLEGDPGAAYEYWRWAAADGGLLLTPARNWP